MPTIKLQKVRNPILCVIPVDKIEKLEGEKKLEKKYLRCYLDTEIHLTCAYHVYVIILILRGGERNRGNIATTKPSTTYLSHQSATSAFLLALMWAL